MQSNQHSQGVPLSAALIAVGLMVCTMVQVPPASAAERVVLCEEFTNSM